LSYIFREQLECDSKNDDDERNYESLDDEMVARAPIVEGRPTGIADEDLQAKGPFSKAFLIDRFTAYNLMHDIFGESEVWIHAAVKKDKSKCGRRIWQRGWTHYLGPNNV